VGVAGALVRAVRRWRSLPWGVVAFFGAAMLISWGMTLTRGIVYIALPNLYLPVARHSYPVIIPTMLLLCVGWLEAAYGLRLAWLSLTGKKDEVLQPEASETKIDPLWVTFLGAFLALDAISLLSIVRFYA
jgi:hypothetical protein